MTKTKNKSIFLSVPMSGFDDKEEYMNFRTEVLEIFYRLMEVKFCSKVYFAGLNNDIESPKDSFIHDLQEIDDSDIFVLIFPKRVITSALIEIGYAIGKSKEILIFCKDNNDLPYLLKEFDLAYENGYLYRYLDNNFIVEKIEDHLT